MPAASPFQWSSSSHGHRDQARVRTAGGSPVWPKRPFSFSSGSAKGFTLIETMIVLAILAIVVALALPSYNSNVRKARRADATSTLLNGAQQLERCFTRFNAYNDDDCGSPAGTSAEGFYTITAVIDAGTFTLTATPIGAQGVDPCGVFTLDHLGNRTPVPDENRCWGS